MQTFIKFMHWMPSRIARTIGGLWLVIYAGNLSPGYALLLAALGTAIAVTGIGDICPVEMVVNATRTRPPGSQRRAA